MSEAPHAAASEEDRSRANFYALLSRLFHGGPDAALLSSIAASADAAGGEGAPPLAVAWHDFALACGDAEVAAVQQEYDDVFVGTGKAPVTPYCSHYLEEGGSERALARLRGELAGLGLARLASAHEPEDHIAALLEVMRHLVLADGGDAALDRQRGVFERYLEPAYAGFCDAVDSCSGARFYAPAARVLRAFLDVESAALKMI